MLPSKDVFHLLKNLYVLFPDDETIYGVKYSTKHSANKVFKVLEKKQILETMTLSEFLSGLPTNENNAIPNESMYADKSILVILSEY